MQRAGPSNQAKLTADLSERGQRLVEIATLQGAKAEVNIQTIMQRRLTITGSTLRARSDAGADRSGLDEDAAPLQDDG